MGFADGVRAGIEMRRAETERRRLEEESLANRRALQLEAQKAGYDLTDNGFVPNAATAAKINAEAEKFNQLKKLMEEQQKYIEAVTGQNNAMTIKNFILDWTAGDFEGAKTELKNNPLLLQKMKNAKTLQYNQITVPNFDDPDIKNMLKSYDIDTSYLKNPSVREALSKSFFQVYKNDGKIELMPIDDFINQTNSLAYMKPAELDSLKKRIFGLQAIINNENAVKSLDEYELYGDNLALAKAKLGVEKDKVALDKDKIALDKDKVAVEGEMLNQRQSDIETVNKWLKDNPGKISTQFGTADELNKGKLQKILFDLASIQNKTLEQQAISDAVARMLGLSKEGANELSNIYKNYSGDKLFTTYIPDDIVIAAKKYMDSPNIKVDKSMSKGLTTAFAVLQNGTRLAKDVNSLDDEEIAKGIIDTGIQKMKSMLSDKSFRNLSPREREKALKSIEMNTKLGMFLANYVKSISGSQVTNREFDRLQGLFTSSNFENVPKMKASIKTFVNELHKQFKDNAKMNLLNDPATTLHVMKEYKNMMGTNNRKRITATNPKTGERIEFLNGKWVPIEK